MQCECYWCGKSFELTHEQERMICENILLPRGNGKSIMTLVTMTKSVCCSDECTEKFLTEAVKNTDWGRKRWIYAVPMRKE